jgi:L-lactate dehydrogenase complex protein LldG
MTVREEIFSRIRSAVGPTPALRQEIPRRYRTSTTDGLEVFLDRLGHYDARAQQVNVAELDQAVRVTLGDRAAVRVVAPAGLPEAWFATAEPLPDDPPLDPQALDQSDGVVTTCAVAIAQTGTIVLDGGAGMGRRALTLLPDYHLCVVHDDQIVGSIPEALLRLDPTRPLTFISGPSATVDIEMVRVAGVHGPRRLDVIVATGAAHASADPRDPATGAPGT